MSRRADAIDRHMAREEDRLMRLHEDGSLSDAEYNAEMRDLHRQAQEEAREAYEQDREDAMRDIDRDWGM